MSIEGESRQDMDLWNEFWNEFNGLTLEASSFAESLVFRGEVDDFRSSKLSPSVSRIPYGKRVVSKSDIGPILFEDHEEYLLTTFRQSAGAYLNSRNIPKTNLEWMILAQHFGVPTRLLDWTTNPLVALYFAVEKQDYSKNTLDPKHSETDGYLYILRDITLVDDFSDLNLKKATFGEKSENWYVREEIKPPKFYERALFLRPEYIDQRYRNQSTILMCPACPYRFVLSDQEYTRILIPKEIKHMIRVYLRQVGIASDFIYPSLDGAALRSKLEFIDTLHFTEALNS